MMKPTSGSGNELLEIARLVLDENSFATQSVLANDDRPELLLAENADFILVIAQAPDVAELANVDTTIGEFVADRVAETDLGAKRWDIYVVLLCETPIPDGDEYAALVTELRYDTHLVRRLVRAGVAPTINSVRSSLRIVLPLGQLPQASAVALTDPLKHLEQELRSQGLSDASAERAIAAFRATGEVIDG
jgi:hypothetical protein